jgi:hypothetical protein
VGATCCTQRDLKNANDIESLPFFGAFRLLLGGSTHVQHPLAKYEIYLTFSKSYSV